MKNFNLGIVVLNFKDYEQTIICVKDYLKQKNVNIYIVIVDNDSPNESLMTLKEHFLNHNNVAVISSHFNGGYAYGNNVGIRHILSEVCVEHIVVSNNDVVLKDNLLLSKWFNIHKSIDSVGITSPIMLVNGEKTNYSAWKMPTFLDDFKSGTIFLEKFLGDKKVMKEVVDCASSIEVDCLPGSLFMINSSLIEKVGLFDEGTFLYMEEVILAKKINKIGKKNQLLSELFYEHLYSATISSIYNQLERRKIAFRSQLYYALKYREDNLLKIILLIVSHIIGNFLIRIRSFFHNN